ncbi:MAG: hypothetical protein WC855_05590 [Thermodesulfovibrionales bacterium]
MVFSLMTFYLSFWLVQNLSLFQERFPTSGNDNETGLVIEYRQNKTAQILYPAVLYGQYLWI